MRIRTIKPEFWSHPVMGRKDDAIKLLAIGLLNYADDEGYFEADPVLIRAAIRPFDEDSTIVRRCIDELSNMGYLQVRESSVFDGVPRLVGRIVSFAEHQRVDRPKPSKIKELFNSSIDRRGIDEESTLEGKGTGNRERNIGSLNARAHEEGGDMEIPASADCDPSQTTPTLDAVKSAGAMAGAGDDCAEAFFHEMEACGWIDSRQRPILNWKSALSKYAISWRSNTHLRSTHWNGLKRSQGQPQARQSASPEIIGRNENGLEFRKI